MLQILTYTMMSLVRLVSSNGTVLLFKSYIVDQFNQLEIVQMSLIIRSLCSSIMRFSPRTYAAEILKTLKVIVFILQLTMYIFSISIASYVFKRYRHK